MPDLEMLLRDVRPAPDPDWTARLDAQVAARFPRPVPRLEAEAARAARPLRRALAGRGDRRRGVARRDRDRQERRDGGDDSAASSAGGGATCDVGQRRELAATRGGEARRLRRAPRARQRGRGRTSRPPTAPSSPAPRSRSRRAADDVEAVTDRAIRLTDTLGGYVQTSTSSREGSRATATLTLKLPSDKLDDGHRADLQARARAVARPAHRGRHRPARGARGRRARRPRRPRRPARPPEQGDDRQGALTAARAARPRQPRA